MLGIIIFQMGNPNLKHDKSLDRSLTQDKIMGREDGTERQRQTEGQGEEREMRKYELGFGSHH